jgi:hypothetical protein
MRRTSQSTSQPANTDKYGTLVKRNSIVMFRGGATARVRNVHTGTFRTVINPTKVHLCKEVEVVSNA